MSSNEIPTTLARAFEEAASIQLLRFTAMARRYAPAAKIELPRQPYDGVPNILVGFICGADDEGIAVQVELRNDHGRLSIRADLDIGQQTRLQTEWSIWGNDQPAPGELLAALNDCLTFFERPAKIAFLADAGIKLEERASGEEV